VSYAIGGGWGKEAPEDGYEPVTVIRGTDFSAAKLGQLAGCPRRYEKSSAVAKRKLRDGDLLLEISGGNPSTGVSTGRVMLFRLRNPASAESAIPASFCRLVRVNRTLIEPRFAYYSLLQMHSSGRARLYENQSTGISNFQFERFLDEELQWLPPLSEQRRIAGVLQALDEKIELISTINRRLEDVARLTFEREFSSKLAGCPTTALDDALVIETGKRPKGGVSLYTDGVPSVGAESIVGLGFFDYSKTKFVPREFFAAMKSGRVSDRDVLLYKDGGRPGMFEPHVTLVGEGFPFTEFCINEHVYRLRVRKPYTQEFLYFWLTSNVVMEEMRRRGTGVAIPGLNSTAVRGLPLPVLEPAELALFTKKVEEAVTLVLRNCKQARGLNQLRDLLLPKLVSGQLHVPESYDPDDVLETMAEQASLPA
jgi:restriction endonuclease S subunit